MKTTMILPVLFAAILSACTKTDVPAEAKITDNPSIETLPSTVNKSILLRLVNEVRSKGCQCGDTYYYPVSPLTWNRQLELAAYRHSSSMYQLDYFSHIDPSGNNAGTRIERAGYLWKAYGENIASGFTTEQEVVDGWLKSPKHCKNIMGRQYQEMGVARVGNYWTQEFATR